MINVDTFIGAFILAAVVLAWHATRRRQARPPFPIEWQVLFEQRLPLLRTLRPELRARHQRRVQDFLADVRFVGCDGLQVTQEMRLLVAGLACLLVLRLDASVFRRLHAILLYPRAFWVQHPHPDAFGRVSDDPQLLSGESWNGERVILSWDNVEAALAGDKTNVVAHKFAHQLDDETPDITGAPKLADYTRWSLVMKAEYAKLQLQERPPVLNSYGAQSPAEFFAVCTEAFFQRGAELRHHHAELYRLLADYYGFETVVGSAPETAQIHMSP